ncbi:hypothetical protein CP556_00920 [Natrinema sp. CBA1119]|nr:hypothetical protein CP556_00920 [Natrinema sp. CBA1119]
MYWGIKLAIEAGRLRSHGDRQRTGIEDGTGEGSPRDDERRVISNSSATERGHAGRRRVTEPIPTGVGALRTRRGPPAEQR